MEPNESPAYAFPNSNCNPTHLRLGHMTDQINNSVTTKQTIFQKKKIKFHFSKIKLYKIKSKSTKNHTYIPIHYHTKTQP